MARLIDGRRIGSELGVTANGEVVRDLEPSHIRKELADFVRPALPQITPNALPFQLHTVDFLEMIWVDALVRTRRRDYVYFAQRSNRDWLTRLVDKKPKPTSKLVVGLMRNEGELFAWSTFSGTEAPQEPTDICFEDLTDPVVHATYLACRKFWSRHALCASVFTIVEGTKTVVCPWR